MYPPIPAGFDDVLLSNENDELTEFTIGNLVAEIDGELFTPSVACGLLAGTFRSHLLETGEIKERVISKDELENCSKLFLVNSVRKWIKSTLKILQNPQKGKTFRAFSKPNTRLNVTLIFTNFFMHMIWHIDYNDAMLTFKLSA